MELIERVGRALAKHEGWGYDPEPYNERAKAAIRAMLDGVESNLSAVQYDPAPYTAMNHRIAAMRKEALGDE